MQNDIRKSWNNTHTSPIREIKRDLGKIAPFTVKETHCLHNSGIRTWHGKIDTVLFSMLQLTAPTENRA